MPLRKYRLTPAGSPCRNLFSHQRPPLPNSNLSEKKDTSLAAPFLPRPRSNATAVIAYGFHPRGWRNASRRRAATASALENHHFEPRIPSCLSPQIAQCRRLATKPCAGKSCAVLAVSMFLNHRRKSEGRATWCANAACRSTWSCCPVDHGTSL